MTADTLATALWRRIDLPGMERCELAGTPDGFRIAGTTLFSLDERAIEIRYSIALDAKWRTQIVGIHVRTPEETRSVALRADGEGTWEVGGDPVPDLDGAIDVDLAWTPATNTIPIRRLGLDVGMDAQIFSAFVPFPDRVVSARAQSYERLAERRYRFTSGDFAADLTVDGDALVTAYPGRWITVPAP